jgi:hypothetical protein
MNTSTLLLCALCFFCLGVGSCSLEFVPSVDLSLLSSLSLFAPVQQGEQGKVCRDNRAARLCVHSSEAENPLLDHDSTANGFVLLLQYPLGFLLSTFLCCLVCMYFSRGVFFFFLIL